MKTNKKNPDLIIFLGIPLVGLFIFKILPIFISFGLSFMQWDLLTSPNWVGIENYIKAVHDEEFLMGLKNNMKFVLIYVPCVISFGLVLAYMINNMKRFQNATKAIYFFPVVTSWVAVSIIWKWLYNSNYGLINYFLSLIGIAGPSWLLDGDFAIYAIIFATIWKDLGFVILIFISGLQNIPKNLYEAADIDGANSIDKFFRVTIPLIVPTLFFVFVFTMTAAFQIFDQVSIMTEGGPSGASMTSIMYIYNNAFRYYKMGYASTLSWIVFFIILTITLAVNKIRKRYSYYEE